MRKILLVAKKEWYRFFGDRRTVISALIFPCVFLYIVYGFLVPIVVDRTADTHDVVVYAVNLPPVIQDIFEQLEIEPVLIYHNEDKEDILEGIAEKNGNFLIVFPENFVEEAMVFDVMTDEIAPEILIYFNSLAPGFAEVYTSILAALNIFERSIAHKFDVNLTSGGDMAASGATERFLLASMLPIFLLMFIFQGAMATTTEAITGEKERGTFATIFLTSITPMELSTGKIFGLSIESFLCGVSASLGLILSLPRFVESFTAMLSATQGMDSGFELNMLNFEQYGLGDLGVLILVLLATSCFIVTLIAIIAVHAKTAKEAQMLAYPMIIVFLFISFMAAFGNNTGQIPFYHYLIPVYNSVLSIGDIISLNWASANIAATVGINLILVAIGCFALSKLIKTEKIIGA